MALKQTVTTVNAAFMADEPNAGVKGLRARARQDSDVYKIFDNPRDTASSSKGESDEQTSIAKQIWGSEDEAELARKLENWKRAREKQQQEIARVFNWKDGVKVTAALLLFRAFVHRLGLSLRKVSLIALVLGLIRAFLKLRAPSRSLPLLEHDFKALPFFGQIGVIPQVTKLGGPAFQIQQAKKRDFASNELVMFGNPRDITLMDPRDREYVLKVNWRNFVKNGGNENGFQEKFAEILGRGIFAVDGDEWQDHRKVASHLFSANGLRSKMERSFIVHGKKVVQLLKPISGSGKIIDFQDTMQNLTFETICDIAFGVQPGALETAMKEGKKIDFLVQFDRVQQYSSLRFLYPAPVWKMMRFFNIGWERVLREDATALSKYVRNILNERRANDELDSADDLLALYVRTGKASGKSYMLEEDYLVDAVMNFMLAGRDTTSSTLTNMFKLLDKNRHVEKKMLEELDAVVGRGNSVTWDHLRELRYCGAVFNETLRLFPPVAFDPRTVLKDDILPSGLRVEAGQTVSITNSAIGRDYHLWEKPDEFIPERWLQEGKPTRRPDEYVFPVFWGGPRLCLGKDMARLEAITVAYEILSNYVVHVLPHSEKTVIGPVQFYEGGLPARIEPRA